MEPIIKSIEHPSPEHEEKIQEIVSCRKDKIPMIDSFILENLRFFNIFFRSKDLEKSMDDFFRYRRFGPLKISRILPKIFVVKKIIDKIDYKQAGAKKIYRKPKGAVILNKVPINKSPKTESKKIYRKPKGVVILTKVKSPKAESKKVGSKKIYRNSDGLIVLPKGFFRKSPKTESKKTIESSENDIQNFMNEFDKIFSYNGSVSNNYSRDLLELQPQIIDNKKLISEHLTIW